MPTTVRSFCKINLGLAVGPPRPDGFHALTTVYQTLGLHDLVTVAAQRAPATRITLQADHPAVPATTRGDAERNTAHRIVALALQRLGLSAEVHITIEKRLPVQGGLGAGSANAAAALIALERELGTALSGPDRLALAAEVGSDVPLFLIGGTILGLNRGEAVFPLPDSSPLPVVVAIPSVGVSTAQAFRDLDLRLSADPARPDHDDLTPPAPADRLEELSRVLASVWTHTGAGRVTTGIASSSFLQPAGREELPTGSPGASLESIEGDLAEKPSPVDLFAGVVNPLLALVRTGVENDFEDVVFRQHPSLRDIKRALSGSPIRASDEESGDSDHGASRALYAALSGSGSALFGIYGSPEDALEAQHRVQSLGTRALLTETLTHREYWGQMFAYSGLVI